MSEVRLTIRDERRAMTGRVERELARAAVAALTAEPETIEELETAIGRFRRSLDADSPLQLLKAGDSDEPWDAGLVMIDLPSRVIVAATDDDSFVRAGAIEWLDDSARQRVKIPFWLPDDWLMVTSRETWGLTVAQRRAHRSPEPPDTRAVLYGKVCEYLVHELRAARLRMDVDPVVDVHARWLLTPRDDLQGAAPRELLLERREEISHDIEARSWQWSVQGECPPTLPVESRAFRCGGYGSHEVSLYHDLVRYLTIEAWRGEKPVGQRDVAVEIAHLEGLRRDWLGTADWEDLHGLSPQQVIDMERSRRPWALTGEQMIIDHDCPMCRMLAEQSCGPTFVHLDPLNSDQHFAFSLCDSFEEWERERKEWEEFDRRYEAEAAASSGGNAAGGDSSGTKPSGSDTPGGEMSESVSPKSGGGPCPPSAPRVVETMADATGGVSCSAAFGTLGNTAVCDSGGESGDGVLNAAAVCNPPPLPTLAPPLGSTSIWQTSGCNLPVILKTGGAMKVGLLVFGIAAHVTELAEDVRNSGCGVDELRQFATDFEDLRAALADKAHWLVDSLITRCVLTLDSLEEERRDLKLKCRDLRAKFEVLRDLCAESYADPEAP